MEEKLNQELDYMKLYCQYYTVARGDASVIKFPLTKLAEAGCDKAIRFWYALYASQKNDKIDAFISGDENDLSYDLLIAKANKEQYSNPDKYKFNVLPLNRADWGHYEKYARWPIMRLYDLAYKKCKEMPNAEQDPILAQEMMQLKIAFHTLACENGRVVPIELAVLRSKFEKMLEEDRSPKNMFWLTRNMQILLGGKMLSQPDYQKLIKLQTEIANMPFKSQVLKQIN